MLPVRRYDRWIVDPLTLPESWAELDVEEARRERRQRRRERRLDPKFEREHPRARGGRFGRKPKSPTRSPGRPVTGLQPGETADSIPDSELPELAERWRSEARVPGVSGPLAVSAVREPGGAPGRSWTGGDRVVLNLAYVVPRWLLQRTFYHELGHLYEWSMPQSAREEFARIMGFGSWDEPRTPPTDEVFAEAYAWAALGDPPEDNGPFGATYGYLPSPEQHAAVAALIRRTGELPLRRGSRAERRVASPGSCSHGEPAVGPRRLR